jgi:hypothetical protein
MRIVKDDDVPQNLEGAQLLEQRKDLAAAITLYEKLLIKIPNDLKIITRLMILYRKTTDYKKELTMIHEAIKIHNVQHTISTKAGKNVTAISRKLNIALGHTDKKGKPIMVPGEVEKLQKRKLTVTKKLNK